MKTNKSTKGDDLTQEYLKEVFEYKDGKLYWKVSKPNVNVGDTVGNPNGTGYLQTKVNYKRYVVHQLIFMLHHGYCPPQVDHIDGDRSNNRIENLREATPSQNSMNTKLRRDNRSGTKGVYSKNGKWAVQIRANGITRYRGTFGDLELAALVAEEARNKYHGEFARHL